VLERAAIIGRGFALDAAARLLPHHVRRTASRHRDALISKGFLQINTSDGPSADDCHVLIQETCYRFVPKQLRAELHKRYARWCQEQAASPITAATAVAESPDREPVAAPLPRAEGSLAPLVAALAGGVFAALGAGAGSYLMVRRRRRPVAADPTFEDHPSQ
jgi:predicted ATPase